jgi:glycosyltransferase involved in cell wall biosynthesis
MKVLIIHTKYKLAGGEDSVVANEIELLKLAGVEVELLEFSNHQHTLLKVLQLTFNLKSFNATRQKIISFKPDIIHIHNLHFAGSPSVIYAARCLKIPVVLTLHNYRLLCPSATLFYKGELFNNSLNQKLPASAVIKGVYLNSKILTLWLGISMWLHQLAGTWNRVNKYIALTPHTKEIFSCSKLSEISTKIAVKPNFCFSNTAMIRTIGEYYLYVGRISEEKGITVLLDAFKENKLPLRIAGTGPLEKLVAEAAKEYSNIVFLGSRDKTEISRLLNGATALIFPSQWYETFGMVIIESFAAGLPVIASRLGHLKLTVTDNHNGLHFEAGNKQDLNNKLTRYENFSLNEKRIFRENALATYNYNYTPEKNIEGLLNIYQQVLSAANNEVAIASN